MTVQSKLTGLGSLFLLLGISCAAVAQDKKDAPQRKSETTVEYRPPTQDERRKQVQELIMQGKYQHDGSGELLYIGTMESVPALIQVLKNHPPTVEKVEPLPPPAPGRPPNPPPRPPRKWYICTYSHAVAALRKITGQNLSEYQEWLVWWEDLQKAKTMGEKQVVSN